MKNFKTWELVDKETYKKMGEDALKLFTPDALFSLDSLRDFFNCPITVNNWHEGKELQWRGWRTPEKAAQLGAPHSQHALGNAFDCTISGHNAEEARAIIMTHKDDPLLNKITRLEADVDWVHFDCMVLPSVFNRIHLFKA